MFLNSGLKITAFTSDFDLDVNSPREKNMLKDNLLMIVDRRSKRQDGSFIKAVDKCCAIHMNENWLPETTNQSLRFQCMQAMAQVGRFVNYFVLRKSANFSQQKKYLSYTFGLDAVMTFLHCSCLTKLLPPLYHLQV